MVGADKSTELWRCLVESVVSVIKRVPGLHNSFYQSTNLNADIHILVTHNVI